MKRALAEGVVASIVEMIPSSVRTRKGKTVWYTVHSHREEGVTNHVFKVVRCP